MPNRILKQTICTSPNLNLLSIGAENLFYRLIVQCDDFGRYYADPSILRGHCYPLRIDTVTSAMVNDWIAEMEQADLLIVYASGRYLQLTNWDKHQTKRADKSKFPEPDADESNCKQVKTDASKGEPILTYSLTRTGTNDAANAAETHKPKNKKAHPSNNGTEKAASPTRQIQAAFETTCGYPVNWAAGNSKAAKWLADNGYTPDQVTGCYAQMKAQPFWKDKTISLPSIVKQIGEYAKRNPARDADGIDYKHYGMTPSGKMVRAQ